MTPFSGISSTFWTRAYVASEQLPCMGDQGAQSPNSDFSCLEVSCRTDPSLLTEIFK